MRTRSVNSARETTTSPDWRKSPPANWRGPGKCSGGELMIQESRQALQIGEHLVDVVGHDLDAKFFLQCDHEIKQGDRIQPGKQLSAGLYLGEFTLLDKHGIEHTQATCGSIVCHIVSPQKRMLTVSEIFDA